MNTRIQVEHTVTELVTGLDLVREQVLVAAGEPLAFAQEDVRLSGHAIECRINAEDPRKGFLPAPGTIGAYREPAGPGVRVDSGVTEGSEIVGIYDPLVAKLVVWDADRERARRRMLRALDEYVIEGVTTLVGFHRALLEHPCFVAGETCFGLVERIAEEVPEERPAARTGAWGRAQEQVVGVELDGRRYEVAFLRPEPPHAELARRRRERSRDGAHHAAAREAVVSPMQGTVLAVEVADGDEVREGQVVCVVEAMKMENEITAHRPGTVSGLSVAEGEPVSTGQVICVVEQEGDRAADDSL
jgi:acetyl-CoA/propionyl-CoA carboxylase biotin carboxyl carrier protein